MWRRTRIAVLGLSLLTTACLAPWLVVASQRALSTMFNAPSLWVPQTFEYRRNYDWFTKAFDCQDVVVISCEGCAIDDERLRDFARELMTPDDADRRRRNKRMFSGVATGPDLMERLLDEPLALSRKTGLARLRGSFVGVDGVTSCAVVEFTEYGSYHKRESLDALLETGERTLGIARGQLHVAGPPVDGAAIDQASMDSVRTFAIPSALIALCLCWWCLRSWLLTAMILAAASFGQGVTLALVDFSGEPMNAILIVMPVLVFVLTISSGVHLANYYLEAVRDGEPDATSLALRRGYAPCLLSAATTVIGLGSLSLSLITPIRIFSLCATSGLLISVALLFLLLPGTMDLQTKWRFGAPRRRREGARLIPLADAIARRASVLVCGFVVLMLLLAGGLVWLRTSVNVHSLFVGNSRVLRDYSWLEQHLAPLVPVELIVQFPADCQIPLLERLELVREVEGAVQQTKSVGGTLSAASFFPDVPAPGGLRQTARRAVLARRLERALADFEQLRYYVNEDGRQSWRISARVSAMQNIDFGLFLERVRADVDPVLASRGRERVSILYTGSLPVAYQAQRALLRDLFRSYLAAFSLVSIVIMLVLRSFLAGAVAMLPNLFPTLLLFGSMGWLGTPVDIGSVMTASVALGIAVDDTLHFLLWYRRETTGGTEPLQAVRNCLRHCGRAMVQTSLICGLGLLVYCFSDFVPTRRFAVLMLGLLLAALSGDLILVPAILLSPLGRLFRRPATTG